MKNIISLAIFLSVIFFFCKLGKKTNSHPDKIIVACYYFPNYHTHDKNNSWISYQHLSNWSEWGLVKTTSLRFEGQVQPSYSWGNSILRGEETPGNIPVIITKLGFNSATTYVWIHYVSLPNTQTDYNYVRDSYFSHWDKVKTEYGVPNFPNVIMGWDQSTRTNQNQEWNGTWGYPYSNTISNNTPENFKKA